MTDGRDRGDDDEHDDLPDKVATVDSEQLAKKNTCDVTYERRRS